jgi:ribosomal-protein-alanine N-acetyltransferase
MSTSPITQVTIRQMQAADLEQVRAIDRISFSLPWPERAYEIELRENQNSIPLVAEKTVPGGEALVVGVVVAWMVLDEVHIATISVHPEQRGQGISRALLARAIEEGIQRGAILATLEVRAGNHAAKALYQSFGFKVVGDRPRYYQDNQEDALIMTVDLLEDRLPGVSYLEWLRGQGYIHE